MSRLLLKLSGEALGGTTGQGIEPTVLEHFCRQIKSAVDAGIELGVVLGGGNLFRGAALSQAGMDRVVGDRMGMLATIMNALALGDFLTRAGIANQVFSATGIPGITPAYERDQALTAMSQGRVVILSGGTGNPLFTTDTAACLRGIELRTDAVLKATNDWHVLASSCSSAQSKGRLTVESAQLAARRHHVRFVRFLAV